MLSPSPELLAAALWNNARERHIGHDDPVTAIRELVPELLTLNVRNLPWPKAVPVAGQSRGEAGLMLRRWQAGIDARPDHAARILRRYLEGAPGRRTQQGAEGRQQAGFRPRANQTGIQRIESCYEQLTHRSQLRLRASHSVTRARCCGKV